MLNLLGHLNAVCRILKYLKVTRTRDFVFKTGHLAVEAYIDIVWVGPRTYRRSTSSYCTVRGETLVSLEKQEATFSGKVQF